MKRDALFLLFNFRDSCVGPALYPPAHKANVGKYPAGILVHKMNAINYELRNPERIPGRLLAVRFSLKMRLVLISSSAIANHVTITETPSFPAAPDFTARVLRFRVQ